MYVVSLHRAVKYRFIHADIHIYSAYIHAHIHTYIQVDKLLEKIWFAITETCLALTIFRDELKFKFIFFFIFLFFCKVFHWLLAFRIEQLHHTQLSISRLTQFRLMCLMVLLNMVDFMVLSKVTRWEDKAQ
jgi:hypothetical protein